MYHHQALCLVALGYKYGRLGKHVMQCRPIRRLLYFIFCRRTDPKAIIMSSKEETKDVDMADASAPAAEGEVSD